MEWSNLVSDEELDMAVKIVTRKTALQIRFDAKLVERLKWREKRVKVQVSLATGKKRIRLIPASMGWALVDNRAKGSEVTVRQLLPVGAYARKCAASMEGDAMIIELPDDYELRNCRMVLPS